jgi:hypothetical protein
MSTGITLGFVIKNPYYLLLNFEDITTDTRMAPKYYSICHAEVDVIQSYYP